MNMYVMMLAHDLKDSGVLVNACCPGWVRTRMGGEDATYSVDEVGCCCCVCLLLVSFFVVFETRVL
jgi:NAD(P)-dependent dehydrogenase (short-subunit alcohol dehydrogenase family)